MPERPGVDTELARLLHRTARLDLATLRGTLEEARRQRLGAGPSLAQMLVQRGLVTPAEVASLLGQAQAAAASSAVPRSGTGTEIARWAGSSGEQSRPAPAPGRPSGRLPARASGSWEIRPAESTEVGRPGEPDRLEAWRTGGRVGDYVLERQAGAGAMGVVFIARHAHTGGRYAIKTLRNGEDPTLVERFRREGEAQAKVDGHQNVARVHSMGEAHGRLYIVMELVEGDNLDERIKLGTPPWPEAARIVAGVARGLAHMHGRGVLHRDLKPSNVLFDADGTPKLVDFGLAKPAGADRLTLTGEIVGTPAYMAPEQALGHREEIGWWTDAWALGGVLFYVLTGRPPFDGVTSMEVITRVAEEEAPSPRSVRPDVPQELEALCRSLMRRPTAVRLTAVKAAERLEAFAAAAERAAGARDVPPTRAPRGLVPLAGLALASTVIGVAALSLAAREAAPTPEPPPVRTRVAAPEAAAPTRASALTAPAAPEPEPARAAAAVSSGPWTAGRSRTCVVRSKVEGEYPTWSARMRLALEQRLEMRWDVAAVEGTRVRVSGAVEGLAITASSERIGGGPDDAEEKGWRVHFDSRRDAGSTSPFMAAVGAPLEMMIDAASGQVLELRGAEEAQRAIAERARTAEPEDEGRRGRRFGDRADKHHVPLLADPQALRETLNGVLHAVPPSPHARKWTLTRAPEVGGPYWPGGMSAEVEVLASDEEPTLSWTGARHATYRPRFPEGAQGTLERMIHGRATLTPERDRVVSGEFKETWRSKLVGRPGLGMRGVYEVEVSVADAP